VLKPGKKCNEKRVPLKQIVYPDGHPESANAFSSSNLIRIFNQCFLLSHNTRLMGGASEPLYVPAKDGGAARVVFTRDYFASALHEISHWCIAGVQRRQKLDYGYWYEPDGRTAAQQQLFEQVEVKPQALEWLFSRACGHPFRVSADNLNVGMGASPTFKKNIATQAQQYCVSGVGERAAQFLKALSDFYSIADYLNADRYRVDYL